MLAVADVRKAGFTLLESIVVLLITCSTIGMGLVNFRGAHSEQQEKIFFKRFEMGWQEMERLAMYEGCQGSVIFIKDDHSVMFHWQHGRERHSKYLDLPPNLEPYTDRTIRIGRDGIVAPTTVILQENGQNKYRLAAQLGWGVYEITRV